jgi:hypothetical protein
MAGRVLPALGESLGQRLGCESARVVLIRNVFGDEARVIAVRLRPDLWRLAVGSVAELAGTSHEGGKVVAAAVSCGLGATGGRPSCWRKAWVRLMRRSTTPARSGDWAPAVLVSAACAEAAAGTSTHPIASNWSNHWCTIISPSAPRKQDEPEHWVCQQTYACATDVASRINHDEDPGGHDGG